MRYVLRREGMKKSWTGREKKGEEWHRRTYLCEIEGKGGVSDQGRAQSEMRGRANELLRSALLFLFSPFSPVHLLHPALGLVWSGLVLLVAPASPPSFFLLKVFVHNVHGFQLDVVYNHIQFSFKSTPRSEHYYY